MRPRQALIYLPAAVALGLLVVRLARDVHGKPLIEDEAVAGLIGARPLGELLGTVLGDRGGAPLHFLLVHLVFAFDSSAAALRWLSVAFAVGAVLACGELGRRLGGPLAGAAAAITAATSGLLTVYGAIGRMYALFAFVGALAALLFVRALELRTTEAAFTAAIAAWFLPATHPYGGIAVAVEASIALMIWRGRPLKPAVPVVAIAVAALPFAFVDLHLARRFSVGGGHADPGETWSQLEQAVRGSAGGGGPVLVLFLLLAAVGLTTLFRDRPPVAALAAVWMLGPPILFLVVRSGSSPDLSPRHLIYALPLWAAIVGVGAARLVSRLGSSAQAAALGLLVLVAAFAPLGVPDPRSLTYVAHVSTEKNLAKPAIQLKEEVGQRDVLFPFSPVFLAALPETGRQHSLPRAEPELLERAMRRVEIPVGDVFVAVPGTPWLIIDRPGPFDDRIAILDAISSVLEEARNGGGAQLPPEAAGYIAQSLAVLAAARGRLDSSRVR